MALPNAKQHATRPSYIISWTRDADATPEPLTGATLTGKIRHQATKVTRDIEGDLVITDAANAVFRWDRHADDVAEAGAFIVEFTATFASAPTIARTMQEQWSVQSSLG